MSKVIECNIRELADIERAKKDKIYPAGCTLIQLSATHGQMVYMMTDQHVDGRYAVVMPHENVTGRYLYISIENVWEDFFHGAKTGINLMISALDSLVVYYDTSASGQRTTIELYEAIEKQMQLENSLINGYKQVKETMLDKMLL